MTLSYDVSSKVPFGKATDELNLIRYSQSGDRNAFASLYEAHLDPIQHYVYFRVFDHDVAEDITSLVFLKVWENLGSFNGGQIPFAKWLYRIAHNTVIDYYRTRKNLIPLEDVSMLKLGFPDRVEEKIDIHILSDELVEALKVLSDAQREVLILRFIFGLTTKEIARKLQKAQGAVRALQMRGLRRLAELPAINSWQTYE
jgi:RNA polymerase sigma-70 factor, ECF subfamily